MEVGSNLSKTFVWINKGSVSNESRGRHSEPNSRTTEGFSFMNHSAVGATKVLFTEERFIGIPPGLI